MKKLNLFGVLFLSVVMLSTGCHRKPNGTTPIPGMNPPANQEPVTSPGATVTPDTTPVRNDTGIPSDPGAYANVLEHGKPDREKFAADTVHFDFDSATVKSSEESKLQDVAKYFAGNSTDGLIVEGNCDERGTEKYNLSLGDRRALAIREYLANLGVNPQRIKTVTYGASKPVDPGHSEAAWKQNRRGDLVLMTR